MFWSFFLILSVYCFRVHPFNDTKSIGYDPSMEPLPRMYALRTVKIATDEICVSLNQLMYLPRNQVAESMAILNVKFSSLVYEIWNTIGKYEQEKMFKNRKYFKQLQSREAVSMPSNKTWSPKLSILIHPKM